MIKMGRQTIVFFICMPMLLILLTQLQPSSAANAKDSVCQISKDSNYETCPGRGTTLTSDTFAAEFGDYSNRVYGVITSNPAAFYIVVEAVIIYKKGVSLKLGVRVIGFVFVNTVKIETGSVLVFVSALTCVPEVMKMPSKNQVPGAPGLTLDNVNRMVLISVSAYVGYCNTSPCNDPIYLDTTQRGLPTQLFDLSQLVYYQKIVNGSVTPVQEKVSAPVGTTCVDEAFGEGYTTTALSNALQSVVQLLNGNSGYAICNTAMFLITALGSIPVRITILFRIVLMVNPYKYEYLYFHAYVQAYCKNALFVPLCRVCGSN